MLREKGPLSSQISPSSYRIQWGILPLMAWDDLVFDVFYLVSLNVQQCSTYRRCSWISQIYIISALHPQIRVVESCLTVALQSLMPSRARLMILVLRSLGTGATLMTNHHENDENILVR